MPAPAAELRYNTKEEIASVHQELRQSFAQGKTLDISFRKHQLKQLSYLLNDNVEAIAEAIGKDLGRCKFESVFAEIMTTTNEIVEAIGSLNKWAKGSSVWSGVIWAMHRPNVRKDPKGAVMVIGAWNYPIAVQIGPVIGALAAGCTVLLKPSEVAAHSAKLLAELWPKYMDPKVTQIINGGIDETTQLLDLPWDHIFYTGNGVVGRIIARKAAEHLCPTTLELGGKSPVIVDDTADVSIAAHRILWGKAVNVGQTCIAPDYILCTPKMQTKLVEEFKKVSKEFWPDGMRSSPDFGRIINDRQFKRLAGVLENTKATIALGGQVEAPERYMDLTVLTDVKADDAAMQGELFGPVLPIVPVRDVQGAIDFINANDRPLALYIFGGKKTANEALRQTRSGGVVQGDLLIHYVVKGLPFGGTGPSGYGSYHGKAGFDAFSHERCVVHAPASGIIGKTTEMLMTQRYPPYKPSKLAFMRMLLGKNPSFSRPEKQYKA